MAKIQVLFCLCFLAVSSFGSRVTIGPDGGYSNIVIKMSRHLPSAECSSIINSLKELLRTSSTKLNQVLSGQGYFESATIVVPSSWTSSDCGTSFSSLLRGTAYRSADVVIDEDHPVYGPSPFTQQSRGCGEPGDRIYLPKSFLTSRKNNASDAADNFVEQWQRYRYGVFDDKGYPGDKLYPGQIDEKEAQAIVGASGSRMKDMRECGPVGDLTLTPDSDTSLTASRHQAPTENTNCNLTSSPSPIRPTKQTVLCDGQTKEQVIAAHPDFSTVRNLSKSTSLPLRQLLL